MPLFNIPLILRLLQRKSSEDLSLVWVSGVWVCVLLMLPWSLVTTDIALRAFGLVNFIFFSFVTFLVFKYRRKKSNAA